MAKQLLMQLFDFLLVLLVTVAILATLVLCGVYLYHKLGPDSCSAVTSTVDLSERDFFNRNEIDTLLRRASVLADGLV